MNSSDTKPLSGYELRKLGRYEDAITAYARQYADDEEGFLASRGKVYMDMGQYRLALEDLRSSLQLCDKRNTSESQFLDIGTCYWHLNDHHKAIDTWRQGLNTIYADAAGGATTLGVLLYAGTRTEDSQLHADAVRLLRKHVRRTVRTWPGPIVPFLLGRTTVADLEQSVKSFSGHPTLAERWMCQANFYVALRALREDDRPSFQSRMTQCAASHLGLLVHEYYLARWEVNASFPIHAFH